MSWHFLQVRRRGCRLPKRNFLKRIRNPDDLRTFRTATWSTALVLLNGIAIVSRRQARFKGAPLILNQILLGMTKHPIWYQPHFLNSWFQSSGKVQGTVLISNPMFLEAKTFHLCQQCFLRFGSSPREKGHRYQIKCFEGPKHSIRYRPCFLNSWPKSSGKNLGGTCDILSKHFCGSFCEREKPNHLVSTVLRKQLVPVLKKNIQACLISHEGNAISKKSTPFGIGRASQTAGFN